VNNKNKFRLFRQSLFVLGIIVALSTDQVLAQNPYDFAAANTQGAANGFAATAQVASPFDTNAAPGQNTAQYSSTAVVDPNARVTTPGAQTVIPNAAIGQNVISTEMGVTPVYGRGYTTVPDYPRNNRYTPEAEFTPEPAPEYPQTKDEMVPELIRRDPALPPYQQQETYSYMTNTSTSSSTACQLCNEGYGNPYMWQIGAGVVVRHHSRMKKSPSLFYISDGSNISELNANTSYSISPGLNVSITRYLGRNAFNYDIWGELTFDGLYNWEASNTYILNTNTQEYSSSFVDVYTSKYGAIPGLTSWEQSYTTTDESETSTTTTYKSVPFQHHMNYDIDMNTGELVFQFRKRGRPDPLVGHPNGTWTRECQSDLSYTHAFGFSYINNKESLDWDGYANVYSKTDSGDYSYYGQEYGYVHNKTTNNMLGAVIGGEFTNKHCVWSWGMKWRCNPYINFEKVTTEVSDGYLLSMNNTGISYQGVWGIYGTLKTGKYLKWRLGYDVSILGNTATAAKNMSYSPNDAIDDTAYTVYQTLTLKCSAVW